jgi:hypothetical protein
MKRFERDKHEAEAMNTIAFSQTSSIAGELGE